MATTHEVQAIVDTVVTRQAVDGIDPIPTVEGMIGAQSPSTNIPG